MKKIIDAYMVEKRSLTLGELNRLAGLINYRLQGIFTNRVYARQIREIRKKGETPVLITRLTPEWFEVSHANEALKMDTHVSGLALSSCTAIDGVNSIISAIYVHLDPNDHERVKYHTDVVVRNDKLRVVSLACDNPGCMAYETPGAARFKKCTGCRAVRYCSTECQRAHWRVHRAHCRQ